MQLLTSSSEWQNLYTESSDWTSLVADLVCRQLGFQSGLRGFSSDYDASVDTGPSSYGISNLNCPASAVQFFANCTFDVTPTAGDSRAVVQCSSNGTYVDMYVCTYGGMLVAVTFDARVLARLPSVLNASLD